MKDIKKKAAGSSEELPGYKPYPDSEDIYAKDKETDIDPEKLAGKADAAVDDESLKKQAAILSGGLDVPGDELDDEAEAKGAEDEENNYYSLGGDNHVDLEEDKGS
ncbi:MAG: hypothetical protein JNK43_06080 [Ignavibacteria bacterium]|nr:hypothetical protein [Ignavibacteria bacterium]